jgi:hypothetical protein
VVFKIKYRVFSFGEMGNSDLSLYHMLRNKLGEQETVVLVEFIHSEVMTEMDTVKTNLEVKTSVFLTKEDKIDLINRIDITKSDLIDRMDFIKVDLVDRINKVKTDLIVWIVGVSFLQYIVLMVTRKFF